MRETSVIQLGLPKSNEKFHCNMWHYFLSVYSIDLKEF